MQCVDDFRLRFGKRELVPIVCGGMGVDISTAGLALEVARLGGIGHISDAMVQTVSDRRFDTKFVKEKAKLYKYNVANTRQIEGDVRSRASRRSDAHARRPDHGGQAWRRHDLRQLHGKADDERAARDAARAPHGRARCRDRRHHAERGTAPRLAGADRRPSALSRRQARHHRLVAAGAAAFPAQERAARPAARLRRGRRTACRRAPRFRRRRLGQVRPAHDRRRDRAVSEGGRSCHPADPGRRDLHRERRRVLSRRWCRRGAGGDAIHGGEGMRAAGQDQAGVLQGRARAKSWSTRSPRPATRCAC